MTRLALVRTIAIVLAGLLVGSLPSPANEPKAAPGEMDFGNKVLIVRLNQGMPEGPTVVLAIAQVKRLGDRWFLTGKQVSSDHPEAKPKGPALWLWLNDVITIQEYDSIDEYRKGLPGQAER